MVLDIKDSFDSWIRSFFKRFVYVVGIENFSFFSMLLEKQSCEKCSLLTHASTQPWLECDNSCEPASSFPTYLRSHSCLPGVCTYLCSVCLLSLISLCRKILFFHYCLVQTAREQDWCTETRCFSHTCLQPDRLGNLGSWTPDVQHVSFSGLGRICSDLEPRKASPCRKMDVIFSK